MQQAQRSLYTSNAECTGDLSETLLLNAAIFPNRDALTDQSSVFSVRPTGWSPSHISDAQHTLTAATS